MANIIVNSVKLPNGETIGYRKAGEGSKVLVLIHGNQSTSMHWDTVMESLPAEYTAYAMDMRGFGMSSYNARFDSLRELSEDLKLFADAIGLRRFCLAGWSTGGGVAMYFAIDYPEYVEKLILIESVGIKGYPIPRLDSGFKPIDGEYMSTKQEIAVHPTLVAPVLKAFENKDKAMVKAIWDAAIFTFRKPEEERYDQYLEETMTEKCLVDIDYSLVHFNISDGHNGVEEGTGEVHKIKAPTLVVHGRDDLVVPVQEGIDIAGAIGANAKLELLENGGHAPMVDDFDRFMDIIFSFMNQK